MVKKIPRKTAEYTKQAMITLFSPLPAILRKTSTLDNGCEFTKHGEFTETMKMFIYFAQPYHSWERGGNENANGMIRRYFPKGTNFGISLKCVGTNPLLLATVSAKLGST